MYTQQPPPQYQQVREPQLPLFDDALKANLKNIALNQLNFFRVLNRNYPYLLIEMEYNAKAGNDEAFWESMVVDYENYMELLGRGSPPKWSVSREIEFVWRVHLLNPQCYATDCMRKFGKVIQHNASDPNTMYPAHTQQSFRQKVLHNRSPGRTGFIMPDFVMTDAIKRQCQFIHKMIKINLWQTIYLENIDGAITRYEQFMAAMWARDKPQGLILVPTNDIDLIWHSHQLDPAGYHRFCTSNSPTGQLVSHNDNIAPSVLSANNNATEAFWNKKYGADSYKNGRQFRQHWEDPSYQNMKIYNPWPLWKVWPPIAGVLIVAATLILVIGGEFGERYQTEGIILIVVLVLSAWFMWSQKIGDLAERRRRERADEAMRRRKHADHRRRDSGGCGGGERERMRR